MPRGQRDGYVRPYSRLSRPEPLLFLPSSSSVVLNEAEWTAFETHCFSGILAGGSLLRSGQTQVGGPDIGDHAQ
jgi:hypothetical protein